VFVIIALAAATLGLAVRLPSANPTGNPLGPSLVSYNQGIASKYHPPLSSMGMAAVNRVLGQLPRTGSVNRPAPTPDLASIPVNGFRFVNDASYMPQTETSVDIDPANIHHVVGGVNDFRFFLCPLLPGSDCPSGYTKSLSAFTVSVDGGRTVLKGDAIPGMTKAVLNGTGVPFPEFLASFGDPSVAAGVTGNFYYASLSISLNSSANGIELAVSNAGLLTRPSTAPRRSPRRRPTTAGPRRSSRGTSPTSPGRSRTRSSSRSTATRPRRTTETSTCPGTTLRRPAPRRAGSRGARRPWFARCSPATHSPRCTRPIRTPSSRRPRWGPTGRPTSPGATTGPRRP